MDYQKLINDLKRYGLNNGSALGRHMGIMDVAATSIESLLVENRRLNRENLEQSVLLRDLEAEVSELRAQQAREKNELMTNGDSVRAMNDNELAIFLKAEMFNDFKPSCHRSTFFSAEHKPDCSDDCVACVQNWLQQTAGGED